MQPIAVSLLGTRGQPHLIDAVLTGVCGRASMGVQLHHHRHDGHMMTVLSAFMLLSIISITAAAPAAAAATLPPAGAPSSAASSPSDGAAVSLPLQNYHAEEWHPL